MPVLDRVLWVATAALSACVLLQLYRKHLLAQYRAFALMLAVGLLRDGVLVCLPFTRVYTIAWIVTLPFLLDAQAAAAVNCYRQLSGMYPRIGRNAARRFGRYLLFAGMGCLVTLPWEWPQLINDVAWVRTATLAYQWVDGLAAGGLWLAVACFSFVPPLKRVPRNLRLHTALLAGYFLAYFITCVAKNVVSWGTQWFEPLHMTVVALLYLGWVVGMRADWRGAERLQVVPVNSVRLWDRLRKHDSPGGLREVGGFGNRV